MSDRVTIVLRTRNRPIMLARALASIGAQTFTGYRVVVVNDAGDEQQVRAVIDAQDPGLRQRIELVTNETSKGREAALESGLAASALEYFAVHDDDDAWHPRFLEETVAHLDAHPEMGGVTTRCEIVRERVHADGECTEIEREALSTESSGLSLVDTLVENYAPPISQLIRRRVADRIGHWDGTLSTQADWEFNLRLLAATPVGFIDGPPLAEWHHRDTEDQDLGNSVVTDAKAHARDNLRIRDRYLRSALASQDPARPDLGQALLSAELYRRTRTELRRADGSSHSNTPSTSGAYFRGSIHSALDLVHADMVSTMASLHDEVHALRQEVSALRAQVESHNALQEAVKRTVGMPVRAIRRIRRR